MIFNLLEQAVSREYGADLWDDMLDAGGAEGVYTSLGNYDDAEMERLMTAACTTLGISRDDALRWFGRAAMPELAVRYPDFFVPHRSGRTFVLGLNDLVHAEVRKLYVGAGCPRFDMRQDGPTVLMGYHSPRRMCSLAHGFLEGLTDHYSEEVEVIHERCRSAGDPDCTLRSTWRIPA